MYKILFFSFLILSATISPAYAYIDPGTGSMLLQGLIGGIAAGITIISVYYRKLKEQLKKVFNKSKTETDKNITEEEK